MTETLPARPSPVRVTGRFDPDLSRGLWLVKWLLLIPHLIVLLVLGAVFWVLTVVAFVAILVTGRYPRAIFGVTVGILRWGWRVAFYGYAANGTDRYPPFTLADVPDYPARLEIDEPPQLSRGLVLVKWWLLALPHYLVLVVLVGAGGTVVGRTGTDGAFSLDGGLISLLVLLAVVALLFTRRYPRGIADLVVGLDRWVLRVVAYAALMTDVYPPFRLDQGPTEPPAPTGPVGPVEPTDAADAAEPAQPVAGTESVGAAGGAGTATLAPPAPPAPPPTTTPTTTTAPVGPPSGGRVALLVAGSLVVLLGLGTAGAGATGLAADRGARDAGGFVSVGPGTFLTTGAAVRTDPVTLSGADVGEAIGEVRLSATARGSDGVFVGIAPTAAVDGYLAGVPQGVWTGGADGSGGGAVVDRPGTRVAAPPATVPIWVVAASGPGTRTVTWTPTAGDWTVVVMNADGRAPLAAAVSAGAQAPFLGPLAGAVLATGLVLLVLGLAGIVVGAWPRRERPVPVG